MVLSYTIISVYIPAIGHKEKSVAQSLLENVMCIIIITIMHAYAFSYWGWGKWHECN